LVNPYFRLRQARKMLASEGIEVILPPEKYLDADLPIVMPEILGLIRNPDGLCLLDAGGDDLGVTVISSLREALNGQSVTTLQVINPFRPFSSTVEGCLKIRDEIEASSRLKVSGLIGNANLMQDTGVEHVYSGYEFTQKLANKSGLALI